jgi:hypothetical protein
MTDAISSNPQTTPPIKPLVQNKKSSEINRHELPDITSNIASEEPPRPPIEQIAMPTPAGIDFPDIETNGNIDVTINNREENNSIEIKGSTNDKPSVIANWNANINTEKGDMLIIRVNWNGGNLEWGNKDAGFKVAINKVAITPDETNCSKKWEGKECSSENFFKGGESYQIEIPLDGAINEIMIVNGIGTNLDFELKFLIQKNMNTEIEEEKISKGEYQQVMKSLQRIIQENSKLNYNDTQSLFYIINTDGVLVEYLDSKLIHTEGYGYDGFLLANNPSANNQELFDKLVTASEKHFPNIRDLSILAWEASDDDSATDADVFRTMNFYQAYLNQKNGIWAESSIDYLTEAQKASKDFLDNATIQVGSMLIPFSGVSDNAEIQSNFMEKIGNEYVFQYNPSYSFSYAANLLDSIDPRWQGVKDTQNEINKLILEKYGVVDWVVVKVNSETGEITISDELDKYFPDRYEGHNIEPKIEWPRFILDHLMNYIQYNDSESKEILDMLQEKYTSNLNGLKYHNYRNELVISLATTMKAIYEGLTEQDVAVFQSEVLGGENYYGNKYYDSSKHTFQQLLIGMLNKLLLNPNLTNKD